MKILLLIALLTTLAQAHTWSVITSEKGKQGPRLKLGDGPKELKIDNKKCTADLVNRGEGSLETRSLICETPDGSKIVTTATCSDLALKSKTQNLADLSFIHEKDVFSIILFCE
jgi:hypothetical protein